MDTDKGATALRIGARLAEAREALGMSKSQAAHRAGLSEARWRQLERGYERRDGRDIPAATSTATLVRMARAVSIDPAEFLELAGYPPEFAAAEPERVESDASPSVRAKTLDVTELTDEQVSLVEAFIMGLRIKTK